MDAAKQLRVSPEVMYRGLGEETVILNLASGAYYGLNPVATRMWSLLADHGDVEKAVDQLTREYDVGRNRLEADLHTFLDQLLVRGLMEARC